MKKILFISWDGPETSYMEGLFMPIFNEIQKQRECIQFHCIQFSWDNNGKPQKEAAKKFNIAYTLVPIARKPIASLASFYTLLRGHRIIKAYAKKHQIDILMPRSNFPAFMVNRANLRLPIVFDADGLPIEERIDFTDLRKKSFLCFFLKSIEKKTITTSSLVLTRSDFANKYLSENYNVNSNKFFVVYNGRDKNFFKFNQIDRDKIRRKYNLKDKKILVYCGSLDGNKYLLKEMINVFHHFKLSNPNSKFLILSGSKNILENIPNELRKDFIIKNIRYNDVPKFLSASDYSIGIIRNSLSMKAVSAVKLGEYLLIGLPVIFSRNIGNSSTVLDGLENSILYDVNSSCKLSKAVSFLQNQHSINIKKNRERGIKYYSLEKSAESYVRAIERIS